MHTHGFDALPQAREVPLHDRRSDLVQTVDVGGLRKPLKVVTVGPQCLRGAVGYPAVEKECLNCGLQTSEELSVGFVVRSGSERVRENPLWYWNGAPGGT